VQKFLDEHHSAVRNLIIDTDDVYAVQAAFDSKWESGVPFTLVLAPDGSEIYRIEGEADILALRRRILGNLPTLACSPVILNTGATKGRRAEGSRPILDWQTDEASMADAARRIPDSGGAQDSTQQDPAIRFTTELVVTPERTETPRALVPASTAVLPAATILTLPAGQLRQPRVVLAGILRCPGRVLCRTARVVGPWIFRRR
jgi:hypothetical protein